MCINRHVLLVSKRRDFYNIKKVCMDKSLVVTHATSFCDMIESLATYRYSIIFIDNSDFFVNDDILDLLKRKNYFVPFVIVLNEAPIIFNGDNILCINPNELDRVEEAITFCQNNDKSQNYLYTDSYLKEAISKNLEKLGFLPKYKGYMYLSSMIYRIISNENSSSNFQNSIYPFVAALFGVSEASIERDVRNLISQTVAKLNEDDILIKRLNGNRPSCKNIIHIVTNEMKQILQIK